MVHTTGVQALVVSGCLFKLIRPRMGITIYNTRTLFNPFFVKRGLAGVELLPLILERHDWEITLFVDGACGDLGNSRVT